MRNLFLMFAFAFLCSTQVHAQNGLLDVKPHGSDVDLNQLKLNPEWKCQQDANCNGAPRVPDATICDHKNGASVSVRCRTQPSSDDVPTAFFKKTICSLANSQLHGHVNFEEPVTLTGNLEWDGHSDDFDYDFYLTTVAGRLVTSHNHTPATIALELDSRETLDRFTALSGWWGQFQLMVNDKTQLHSVSSLFDSHANNAVAIGLLGVDCEHACHSELHPIYALAFRAADSTAAKEHWIVLARNFGDEGFCSHLRHSLGSTSQFPALHILIPKPAANVSATGTFVRTAGATGAVDLTPVKGVGINVSFPLTDPAARQVYLGEVFIDGTSPLVPVAHPAAMTNLEENKEEEGSESVLKSLMAKLPEEKRQTIQAISLSAMSEPITVKATPKGAISRDTYRWRLEHRSSKLRIVGKPETDPVQEINDLRLWKSICTAYDNHLPDERLRDACSPAALNSSSEP